MNAAAGEALPADVPDCLTAAAATMASLRSAGADRFDPVRWCFITALARRSAQQPERVRRILDAKLAAALADLKQRFEQARHDSADAAPGVAIPAALADGTALGALVRDLEPNAAPSGTPPELKSARYFGNTWAKQSVQRQVEHAIQLAPENAGPLNSHFLVLRSLALMREVAPDYMNRFTSYVDTLLCLDAAAQSDKPAVKKPAKARAAKK